MAVRVKELAGLLGLSPATVSMALNNRPGVSLQTRERVVRLAEELEARDREALSVNRGNIQLLIFKRHAKVIGDTPFFSQLMEGMDRECGAGGYTLAVKYLTGERFDPEEANACIARNAARGAVILATEMDGQDMERARGISVPFVAADSYFMDGSCDCVTIGNIQGAYLATRHLIQQGHQRIGRLASSVVINNFTERQAGYEKAMGEHGMELRPGYLFRLESTMDGAYRDMIGHLKRGPELPTAFFADNDIIAMGAMKALKEFEIAIPRDISLVGFDDLPFCALTEPPLTTVNVDKTRLGALAIKRLLEKIRRGEENALDGEGAVKTELSVSLVVRDSVLDLSGYREEM